MAVERLRRKEQGTACAEGSDLPKQALEKEKGILERYVLVKKRRAGSQQNDQSHLLGGQQGIESFAEQGRHLMAGEGTCDVDVAQEACRRYPTRLRMGGDGAHIEGHGTIDDGDGDPMIDGRGRSTSGNTCHTGIAPEDGGTGLRRWRWGGAQGEERWQGLTPCR
jgi:hypothetical protein